MPSMGIYSWELITEYGVENLIRIGTAGSFHEDIKVKDIVIGMAASTDSNYIHAFDVPGTYAPCASYELLSGCERLVNGAGDTIQSGKYRFMRCFLRVERRLVEKMGLHGDNGSGDGSCRPLHERGLQRCERHRHHDHQRPFRYRGESDCPGKRDIIHRHDEAGSGSRDKVNIRR